MHLIKNSGEGPKESTGQAVKHYNINQLVDFAIEFTSHHEVKAEEILFEKDFMMQIKLDNQEYLIPRSRYI